MFLGEYNSAVETTNTLVEFLLEEIEALSPEGNPTYEELIDRIRVLSRLILNDSQTGPEKIERLLKRLRARPLIVPIPGGRIRIDFEFLRDLYTIVMGGWEIQNLTVMKQLLRPGGIVLDIGAHAGHFTILAASTVGAGGMVYSFEPAPANFKRLCENIRLNRFQAHVEAFPLAISDHPGVVEFYDDGGTAGTEYSMFPHRHGEHGIAFSVQAQSLDHFAEEYELFSVNFIKIDTEGAELAVLRGAENILRKNPGISLLIELHPWIIPPEEVCSYLAQHRMRLYDIRRGLSLFSANEANARFSEGGDILATQAQVKVAT
ncbi:MAG: FkbM family methyltransferase [Pseudomonadota bacterium]